MAHEYKLKYQNEIKTKLTEKFGYQNDHQVPKLLKIQINRGLGLAAQNRTILQKSVDEVRAISGQQPVITKAKNRAVQKNQLTSNTNDFDSGLTSAYPRVWEAHIMHSFINGIKALLICK